MFVWPRVRGQSPLSSTASGCSDGFPRLPPGACPCLPRVALLNTWFMTNGLRSFLGTDYGDLVLVKIALFLVMLGFGAANRYWLTPRLLPIDVPRKRTPGHCGCSALRFRLKSLWDWS